MNDAERALYSLGCRQVGGVWHRFVCRSECYEQVPYHENDAGERCANCSDIGRWTPIKLATFPEPLPRDGVEPGEHEGRDG